jgi:hypothetical protein
LTVAKSRKTARAAAAKDSGETKTIDLASRCLFRGVYYGPGKDVEVPADFPVDDDAEPK